MSLFADREMIVSAFTIGAVSIVIGFVLRFARHAPIDHFLAYVLVAAGVLLIFVSSLVRNSQMNTRLLRYLLAALTVLLLAGVLLKDAIQKLA